MIRIAALVLALAACRRPAWCVDDLSGIWRSETDSRFRYKVRDDGNRVVFEPLYPIGGDYGPFKTILWRRNAGLAGATTSTYTRDAKTCPVKFASHIESCQAGKLVLAGETQFEIKIESCEVIPNGVMTSATLVRELP